MKIFIASRFWILLVVFGGFLFASCTKKPAQAQVESVKNHGELAQSTAPSNASNGPQDTSSLTVKPDSSEKAPPSDSAIPIVTGPLPAEQRQELNKPMVTPVVYPSDTHVIRDTKGAEYTPQFMAAHLAKQRETERLLAEQPPLPLAFSKLGELSKSEWFRNQSPVVQKNVIESKFYWNEDRKSLLLRLGTVDEKGQFVEIPGFPPVNANQITYSQYRLYFPP